MKLTAPLTFQPLFVERPWGGRELEKMLHIALPDEALIGELWAITDRPEAQSIVTEGPLAGISIHELWMEKRSEIFGSAHTTNPATSFPILCKILDASEQLSLQVHPKKSDITSAHEEPKTECWYFLKTAPEALCYAGLKHAVTREIFAQALEKGTFDSLLHSFPVKSGESLFVPSGRLHAMGQGIMALEIEENSDTTYRVFDWNRKDAHGKPRELHLEAALASIDFQDKEPMPQEASKMIIADCPYFHVEKWILESPRDVFCDNNFLLFACLTGSVTCKEKRYHPGDFFLIPAAMQQTQLVPAAPFTSLLRITLPVFSQL
jgi:mannose-6-phosphate isomerase